MGKQDNKYLTFSLNEEKYAIPITKVKEILGMVSITRVPKLPEFIKGVVNIRGQIILVIDVRLKFGLPETEYNDRTSIIIIELQTDNENLVVGFIVDRVNDVLDISPDSIEQPPKYGEQVDQSFLMGMGKVKEEVVMLVDVDRVLSKGETEKIESESV